MAHLRKQSSIEGLKITDLPSLRWRSQDLNIYPLLEAHSVSAHLILVETRHVEDPRFIGAVSLHRILLERVGFVTRPYNGQFMNCPYGF